MNDEQFNNLIKALSIMDEDILKLIQINKEILETNKRILRETKINGDFSVL